VRPEVTASELSPYDNFIYALKSKDVIRQYPSLLGKFLDFLQFNGNIEQMCFELYKMGKESPIILQSNLIKFCILQRNRVEKREISEGTLRNYLKPIKLFFDMNDITVPWKRITKGLPSAKQAADDRCPTQEEIQKLLLNSPDRRLKVIVLVMISSGIRVGAWNWLKWKHVKPIYNQNNELLMAQLEVYGGERDEYFSFITPEAYIALKDYMDFRELHGEKITGESWLIRDTWQKSDKRHGHNIGLAINPKRLDSEGIRKLIYDAWKVQGVTIKKTDSENRNHEFKSSHGFRKFFETHAMQVMYSSNVELLMGHSSSMGLKKNYYKPTEKMLQDDYVKAVNLLTLNNTKLKLEKQIEDQNTKNTETITNISDELLYLRKEVEFLKNKL
jgi:hypothetical protein